MTHEAVEKLAEKHGGTVIDYSLQEGPQATDTTIIIATSDLAALIAEVEQGVANEVQLNIVRCWPDGFANRLEHVWKDLIGFIPNYKLYDLQRMMAEFGFTMKLYEGETPPQRQPLTDAEIEQCCYEADSAPVGNPNGHDQAGRTAKELGDVK